MRFDELQDDDDDDDEWAAALIQAAAAAEEAEWDWRISMARARIEREEPKIAKLVPPQRSPSIPLPRRRSVSTDAPWTPRPHTGTAPTMGAVPRGVSPTHVTRPTVVIPPKEPRPLACGTGAMEAYEESGELLLDAFAAYVIKEQ
jgi:hypothetical protein